MGKLLKKFDQLDFLGQELDFETMAKIATCEICPLTRQPFKELLDAKDAKERE
jgi:hypothetical protein